jgi:hypothetical protein
MSDASSASKEELVIALLGEASAIHAAVAREADCEARTRKAVVEKTAAAQERLRAQTRAAQLLAALDMGPNFLSILAQVME